MECDPPLLRRKTREDLNRNFISTRFPHRSKIISVFGVAVFVCFSWVIINFISKLSSFILYFVLGEIATIFAYMMAFALLESLAFTGFLVLLCALLPSSWLKEGFDFKGFIITIVAAITSILFQNALKDYFPSTLLLLGSFILPALTIMVLIFAIRPMPKVQNILLNIQDRILIMTFIYIPIGLLSLIVVMYRNLS